MPKNDNPHALRMYNAINHEISTEAAETFATKFPLGKSAGIEKKFTWATGVCKYLEENYDNVTIARIRKNCPCNNGVVIADKLSRYLKNAANLKEFVDRFNENESFAFLEYIDDKSFIYGYPTCYCACVKRIPKEISRTWCYCTLGNVKEIFRIVFCRDVKTTLIETIKSGGERCAIRVEL